MSDINELNDRIAVLERLVMALGDKLLILALHLGRLSERAEVR
jgi:endonuclease/exonuclease/phosphatase family metal-dependent hydrolase